MYLLFHKEVEREEQPVERDEEVIVQPPRGSQKRLQVEDDDEDDNEDNEPESKQQINEALFSFILTSIISFSSLSSELMATLKLKENYLYNISLTK